MVTEIIKIKDIPRGYLEIKSWIRYGITNDAIYLCMEKHQKKNFKFSTVNNVRNSKGLIQTDIQIHPLNKW